jgi:tetratricopeptide (TPR) repeat protein
MRLRPKTARRLLLLVVLALVLGVSAGGLLVVRKWQNQRRTDGYRQAGFERLAAKDYPEAVDNLGRYLRRRGSDPEAWLAYAKARENVEEANGSHLAQAASALQKAISFGVGVPADSLHLATLYNRVGYFNEARDAAVKLRPDDLAKATTEHVGALTEEATARLSLKPDDPALEALTARLLELDPASHRALFTRLAYLQGVKRNADAAAVVADRLAKSPDNPALAMLAIAIRPDGSAPDPKELAAAANRVAGLDSNEFNAIRTGPAAYADEDGAVQLVSVFDSLLVFSHSIEVLREAAERLHSETCLRLYARRAWAASRFDDVLKNTQPGASPLHSDVLVFRVLSLRDRGDADEAKKAAAELESRDRDFRARAWTLALKPLLDNATPQDALRGLDAALKEYPGEPVLAFLRGECLARLGRTDEARTVWTALARSPLMPGWITPAVRRTDTLILEGRLDEAFAASREALATNPKSLYAQFVNAHTLCLMLESQRPVPQPLRVLSELDRALATMSEALAEPGMRGLRDSLIPGRVALLATLGRPDDARAQVHALLAQPPAPAPDVLRRLAMVSTRFTLGVENECLAAAGAGEAQRGPDLLFAQAFVQYQRGEKDAALRLVNDRVASVPDAEREAWQIARAQFLDSVRDPGALDAMKSIATAYPASLNAQVAVLRSAAAPADRQLVEATIDRVISLGGSDRDRPSVVVRLARARMLLADPADARVRDEAVSLLRSLATDVPEVLEVRSLLADALLLDVPARQIRPDRVGAMEVLKAAGATNGPDRAPFILRLAALYLEDGRPQDSATELSRLSLDPLTPDRARLAAIDQLIRQRELERARIALDTAIKSAGIDADPDLVLRHADVLAALRRDTEALDAYRALASRPLPDPETAVNVALGLRTLGDRAGSEKLMQELAQRAPRTAAAALAAARFAERTGDAAGVIARCEEAVALDPADTRAWLVLGRFHIARAEHDAAVDAFTRGLKARPDDTQLAVALQQAYVAKTPEKDLDLGPLIDALERDPAGKPQAQALRAINNARAQGKLNDPATLAAISEQFPDSPAAQAFILRRLLSLTPPAIQQGVATATRSQARFPGNAELTELAVNAFAMASDWQPMLDAAQRWQQLTRSVRADLAVGEAQLGLRVPRQALDQVRTVTLPDTIADADVTSMGVLNLRARATAMLADFTGATRLVEPRLASSPNLRLRVAIPLADMAPTEQDASAWITRCAAASDGSSVNEQVALARAWAGAAERFQPRAREFRGAALAIANKISAPDPATSAAVLEFKASIQQAADDVPGAIESCRQALAATPDSPTAANLLARLLMMTDAPPDEAVQAARRAVQGAPGAGVPKVTLALALATKARRSPADADASRTEAKQVIADLAASSLADWGTLGDAAGIADELEVRTLAIDLYERALKLRPAPPERVVAIYRNNIAFLILQEFPTDLPRLRTARDHANAAVQAQPLPDFYETLGSVQAALNDRPAAIAAYRQALQIRPASVAATAGLAEQLAGGTPAERDECRRLIAAAEDAVAKGARLSPFRSRQLASARSKVDAR